MKALEPEDESEKSWMQLVAHEWQAELMDEREDIYSLEDGVPATLTADWLAASMPALQEVWDNEEDVVYDHL